MGDSDIMITLTSHTIPRTRIQNLDSAGAEANHGVVEKAELLSLVQRPQLKTETVLQ